MYLPLKPRGTAVFYLVIYFAGSVERWEDFAQVLQVLVPIHSMLQCLPEVIQSFNLATMY